jgi:hypothetical protein
MWGGFILNTIKSAIYFLAKIAYIYYNSEVPRRGVEQLAARKAHNLEVVGSNPTPATKLVLVLKTSTDLVCEIQAYMPV